MHRPDTIFIMLVLALLIAGFVILSSASVVLSQQQTGNPFSLFRRQLLLGGGVGLLLLGITQRIAYHRWRKLSAAGIVLAVLLLLAVFVPSFGISSGGSSRWIGIAGFSLQPAEFAKLAGIVFLAALFAKHAASSGTLAPHATAILIGVIVALGLPIILQPDVGTFSVIAGIAVLIFFIAGGRWSHIVALLLIGSIVLFALIQTAPYRVNRLVTFLHPELDPQGIGYQINQALLAVGSGGIFGRGLGHSRQKHEYLPEPAGDSIFAIAAEELGFVGTSALVALYIGIVMRGLRIARRAPDRFGQLLVSGMMAWVGLQAFFNIGSLVGLLPVTGIPLPLVSLGSSSTAMLLAGMGMVINVSRHIPA